MITDELREYALGWDERNRVRRDLTAIADRIDAVHERVRDESIINMTDENMAERGWIRLPKDADGEVIHVGDVMESDNGIREVDTLQRSSRKWSVGLVPIRGGAFSWHDAETLRHYHAPTVEDVLREFAEKMNENLGMYTGEAIDAEEWQQADSKTIAEYAAKLQLREDA